MLLYINKYTIMQKKNTQGGHGHLRSKMIYLGPPENIGKQTPEFKNEGKRIVSNLAGDPDKTSNLILKDILIGVPEKPKKVYKPCERLLRKLKKEHILL